jgi:hypothetical protein
MEPDQFHSFCSIFYMNGNSVMTTRQIVLLFYVSVLSTAVVAQNRSPKNDLYLELGGNGIVASVNYERQLTKEPGWGIRLGAGMVPMIGASFPAGLQYLLKTKNERCFFDLGMGITYVLKGFKSSSEMEQLNYIPSFGYRRYSKKNTLFRISFTPIINRSFIYPSVGLSFGKRF